MAESRCIVIPAVKKNAVIPDQLLKRLAGKTLIQRALDTACSVVPREDVFVLADSREIQLVCERNQVCCVYDPDFYIASPDIVTSLRSVLEGLAGKYGRIIIYRASSPLITGGDIEDAYRRFTSRQSDCLVTVKNIKCRLWWERGQDIDALLVDGTSQNVYIETKALVMLRSAALLARDPLSPLSAMPYFLNDRSIEIHSYQDWWICEKLLQRKHIVFVVAGYAAIGMGHIFRALMLAHEIADHRISFVCTRESELAASNIAAKDYRTRIQSRDDLAADVLDLKPDLVINDILATSFEYMSRLTQTGVPVVNFEDEGPGAALATLVVNALYDKKDDVPDSFLYGPEYFCLRDEFVFASQNAFRPVVKKILITFGGTDNSNFTAQTLEVLYPLCRERDIAIEVVTGGGYAHIAALAEQIRLLQAACPQGPLLCFSHATNVMSAKMEGVDLAVCSAGRTVYELAHMRIPAIVISHHDREDMHTFARPVNGFTYLGTMPEYDVQRVREAFLRLLDPDVRKQQYDRLRRFDFRHNKRQVVQAILSLLPGETQA